VNVAPPARLRSEGLRYTVITLQTQFGRAWLALAITLALHVADEALTDFLSVYYPIVREARARL